MQAQDRQLRLKIRELCIYLHSENAGFRMDKEPTSESLAQLLMLSPEGMLAYLRQKAQDVFQQSRLEEESQTYGKALQKLEADCRQKAKVRDRQTEMLLRLQVEGLQQDLESAKLQLAKKSTVGASSVPAPPKVSTSEKSTQTSDVKPMMKNVTATRKIQHLNEKSRRYKYCKEPSVTARSALELRNLRQQLSDSKVENLMLIHKLRREGKSPAKKGCVSFCNLPDQSYSQPKLLIPSHYTYDSSITSHISSLTKKLFNRSLSSTRARA